jgi:hypothetical protein
MLKQDFSSLKYLCVDGWLPTEKRMKQQLQVNDEIYIFCNHFEMQSISCNATNIVITRPETGGDQCQTNNKK